MERVTGIGGVFFKARDPEGLAGWYRQHLGVPVVEGATYATFSSRASGEHAVWSTFPEATPYFAPSKAPFMVNFRVRDLDAMLAQLREAGIPVDEKIEDSEYGRFGWVMDPEGNRIELWQPPQGGG